MQTPSPRDILELDIDLRMLDLWRELHDQIFFDGLISPEQLEAVAAFMRAAYGKGYCDALTEDHPGSLEELDINHQLVKHYLELNDPAFDKSKSPALSERIRTFMRAAYGKGYCDALTEDHPGSLCRDHGYLAPTRRLAA